MATIVFGQIACVSAQSLSHVWLFTTPWTAAHQAPLSTKFFRQEYQSGFPFSSPGALPDSGVEPASPALAVDSSSLRHLWGQVTQCQLMITRYFPKCLEWIKIPTIICRGALCACWEIPWMLKEAVYNSAFLFMQNFKVRQRWELRAFSGLSWACAHTFL